MGSRARRKFTPEFKAEAVAMVEASGGQIARVAKELGIYDSSLGNWVRQAREEAAGAPTASERAEVRELRRELERGDPGAGHPGKSLHEGRLTVVDEIVGGPLVDVGTDWCLLRPRKA